MKSIACAPQKSSLMVLPNGDVQLLSLPFQEAYKILEVPLALQPVKTIYTTFGEWFAWLTVLISFGVWFPSWLQRRT